MTIQFNGRVGGANQPKKQPLPPNARRIDAGNTVAVKIVIAAAMLAAFAVLVLLKLGQNLQPDLPQLLAGFGLAFVCVPLHECLHIAPLPKTSDVLIFSGRGRFAVWFSGPVSRRRYLFSLALPFLALGAAPMLAAILVPGYHNLAVSLLLAAAAGQCGFSFGDLASFAVVLKHVPRGAMLMLSELELYWFFPLLEEDM